ncbi:MAG: hypothetical protein AAFR66_05530 [Bacteroidota bacterium]
MTVKFILPALAEAESPCWRPIKYSLFPPLGLATLAASLAAGRITTRNWDLYDTRHVVYETYPPKPGGT